jgi:hypothetical protein
MARKAHEYNNTLHNTIQTACHIGEELHVVTTNAFDNRVLNLRMYKVMPSKTGYTGYTKVGFWLTKNEARELRDALSEVIENESAWDVIDSNPIKE